MRKAAKKLKVANAAAQKQKEHATALGEKQNVDAAAQMREAPPISPPQTDNQTSQPGEAVEPHPEKRNSPIPSGLDAQDHVSHKTKLVHESTTLQHLDKGPKVSGPADASDPNADTRKSPVPTVTGRHAAAHKQKDHAAAQGEKQNVDDDAQMREAPPTPPPQTDNQTSPLTEAVEPRPDKRNSPNPSGLDAHYQRSHKTTLVNESTTLQHLDKGPELSAPADASNPNADTLKSPVPTITARHDSPLPESELCNNTVLGDANTLLLLQQKSTHTYAPAESVDPFARMQHFGQN